MAQTQQKVGKTVNVTHLQIIQNDRRRSFIKILRELGGKACLREVVRRIAEVEGEPARGLTELEFLSESNINVKKLEELELSVNLGSA